MKNDMAAISHAKTRQHSEVITTGDAVYEIEVGGFRDPINETIIIENLGEIPLVNPRITVNEKYDWFDEETMAREATKGCESDEEKALALYEVDLDNVLYPTGERGRHDHTLEFNFTANEKNDPPTQSGIESIEITTDIQVAPNSLPALSHGKNVIRYRDETPGPRKVRITHIWREQNDTHAPIAPEKPVYPSNGQTIPELAPQLKWEPAREPDGDNIERYCVRISFDPQCRWPIATALEKELAGDAADWQLDTGWLNPDTTYYWRVKAMDSNGVWGDWGDVFSFRTDVNAK